MHRFLISFFLLLLYIPSAFSSASALRKQEEFEPRQTVNRLLKELVRADTEPKSTIASRLEGIFTMIDNFLEEADETAPFAITPLFRFTGGKYTRLVGIVFRGDTDRLIYKILNKTRLHTRIFNAENCVHVSSLESSPYYRFKSLKEKGIIYRGERTKEHTGKPRSFRHTKRGFNPKDFL